MKTEFERLFEPGKIGKLELKNRIVMPAMGNRFYGMWGEMSEVAVEYYRRRAKGGAGLILGGAAFAATAIDVLKPSPCVPRLDDSSYIAGLTLMAEAIHEGGAKAGMQLSPGAGAQAEAGTWIPGYQTKDVAPVSPSGTTGVGHTLPGQKLRQPRALTVEEIGQIAESCANSARYVKTAGFDLIEIHAHGGYLIAQFLSPYFNKRTDAYGGSFDNRCRFLMELFAAMRKAVGPDFPITVKYSIDDYLPGGWDSKQSQALAQKLEATGVDGIGISSGAHGTKMPAAPTYIYPRGIFLPLAEVIKSVVKIPVLVGGRMNDPRMAEKTLKEGKADFICEGRALIADPDWPTKVFGGALDSIRPCLSCNECRQAGHRGQPIRCAVNAAAGKERLYDVIKPAQTKKKVLVVGGGPAGLETARVAAIRGHQVVLCEKYEQLGGLMLLGGVHNEEITNFADWITAQIKSLPIEVKLKTEVTPALVDQIKPDAVVLAIGGTFQSPKIPGIDQDNVFSSKDLFAMMHGKSINKGLLLKALSPFAKHVVNAAMVRQFMGGPFPIKKNVAVIGGQFPGCSLALLLNEKGKKVTIIEDSELLGRDMEANTMAVLKAEIHEGNVKVLCSTKVKEINDKGVVVMDAAGNESLVEAETVVVALDLTPTESTLPKDLRGRVKELYTIGDANAFLRLKNAIAEGFVTACNL